MELPKKIRFIYTKSIPKKARKNIERMISGSYPKLFREKKFIFIHIPKTAGKSINDIIGLKGACHLTYREYQEIIGPEIEKYYIFSITRNPIDRLLSAYSYLDNGGNQSIEDINFKKKWISPHADINSFILKSLPQKEVMQSPFFRPQTEFLNDIDEKIPDSIKLFRFENLPNEINKLPESIKNGKALPHINASSRSNSKLQLTSKSLKQAQKIYQQDFYNLNYTL